MKKSLVAACIALTSFAYNTQAAMKNGFDICEPGKAPVVHGCTKAGILDLPYSTVKDDFLDSYKFGKKIESLSKVFGMDRYYKELEEEADYCEQKDVERYIDNPYSALFVWPRLAFKSTG